MNNLREFIDALFSSETRDQKMKRGMNILKPQEDSDWKKLSKKDGEAATLFYTNYIEKTKIMYQGHLAENNRPYNDVYYFAFLDKETKQKIKSGVYVVYLLSADHKSVYLCLAVGVTEDTDSVSNKVKLIRDKVKSDNFSSIIPKDMIIGGTEIAKQYISSIAYYKRYDVENCPTNQELEKDFREIMELYEKYLKDTGKIQSEKNISVKKALIQIENYISAKGLTYKKEVIEDFYMCLKTKPFVILAGTSGTGKTKLVRLFAEAIGAHYKQVAVKPDWSDSTDVFGHLTIYDKFVSSEIIEFIRAAADDKEKLPHILCLDEMNLARVEYYFSDFLSIMETRDWKEDEIVTDRLVPKACYSGDEKAEELYSNLIIPENLYIVGTVNMDETTFPFSKKVLDRANTIEFSDVDFDLQDPIDTYENNSIFVNNDFLRSKYLNLIKDCSDSWEYVKTINNKVQLINNILKKADAHFGYRVRDEIIFYMLYNQEYGLIKEDDAFDNQIMQKILPRLQGSSESMEKVLHELYDKVCNGPVESNIWNADYADFKKAVYSNMRVTYKRSAIKIHSMLRRYEDDDFTSFWI